MNNQKPLEIMSEEFSSKLYIASGVRHLMKLVSKQRTFTDVVEKLRVNPMFNLVVFDEVLKAISEQFDKSYANPRDINYCACIWALVKSRSTFLEEVLGILVDTPNCFFLPMLLEKIRLARSGDLKVVESLPDLRYLTEPQEVSFFQPSGFLSIRGPQLAEDSVKPQEYAELEPGRPATTDSEKEWAMISPTHDQDVLNAA